MIEAERTPGFLHLLQMTGGASWLHMCIHHRETEGFLSSATGLYPSGKVILSPSGIPRMLVSA